MTFVLQEYSKPEIFAENPNMHGSSGLGLGAIVADVLSFLYTQVAIFYGTLKK